MVDKIFDYLDIEDLEIMTWVSRLFWFAATLERVYEKFTPCVIQEKADSYLDKELAQLFSKYYIMNQNKNTISPDLTYHNTSLFQKQL